MTQDTLIKYQNEYRAETGYCPNCRKIQTIRVNNSIIYGPKKRSKEKLINKHCTVCGLFISSRTVKI